MRLRITRQPSGCIDGIRLDDFLVGFVYEVGTTLGSYLLAEGLAEPADESIPAQIAPVEPTRFTVFKPEPPPPPVAPIANPEPELFPRALAADRGRRRRKRR